MRTAQLILVAALFNMTAIVGLAADVRYYEENGVTYRETRQVVQRSVYQTEMRPTTRTVYRQEQSTENRQTTRTWWSPVTEQVCEAVWVGRWNPFVEPYLAYRPTTRTRWECRTETVQTPTAVSRWVPETQTTQTAVTVRRTVPEEIVSRVAIGRSGVPTIASNSTINSSGALAPVPLPAPSTNPPISVGGVARLQSDPPRRGVTTAWRPSTTSAR